MKESTRNALEMVFGVIGVELVFVVIPLLAWLMEWV